MEQLGQWLAALGSRWAALKDIFEAAVALPESTLHVLASVPLQVVLALVLRRSLRDWVPWGGVLLFELVNEVLDLTEDWPGERSRQLFESASDIAVTIALPTLLLLIARLRPQLLTGR